MLRAAAVLLLASVLALPPLLGDVGTGVILIVSLLFLLPLFSSSHRERRAKTPLAAMFAVAFLLVAIAYGITADEPHEIILIFNLTALLLAIPVVWFLPIARPISADAMGTVAVSGALLAMVTGIFAYHVLGQLRVGWHTVNPIHFGNISVFLGYLGLLGAFGTSKHRWIYFASPVFGLVGVLYSGSRGPLLTGIVLAFVAFGFLLLRQRFSARTALLTLVIFLTLGLIAMAVAATTGFGRVDRMLMLVQSWIKTGDILDASTRIRLDLYQGGWQAFLASPIFGHGWWNLLPSVEPFVSEATWATASDFTHLHNDIIDFLVAGGTLGVMAYLLIISAPLISAVFGPRDSLRLQRLYGASVLTIGFGTSGLTNLLLGNGLQTTLFAFMAALIIGMRAQAHHH